VISARRWCLHRAGGVDCAPEATRVLVLAEVEAQLGGHTQVDTGHLLLSLEANDGGLCRAALLHAGAPVALLRKALARRGPDPAWHLDKGTAPTAVLGDVLIRAGRSAARRADLVTARDLAAALFAEPNGRSAEALNRFGVDPDDVGWALAVVLGGLRFPSPTNPRADGLRTPRTTTSCE
jgi:ATP-dependent Clp protease ATP-binding subunit ClpA